MELTARSLFFLNHVRSDFCYLVTTFCVAHHQEFTLNSHRDMKKSLIGSLTGVAIVFALDTLIRVGVSLYLGTETILFRYNIYPGVIWELSLCFLTLFTSFIGGAVAVSNSGNHRKTGLILFGTWLMALRYGQVHLSMEQELLLPIVALIFSLLAVVLVWRWMVHKKLKTTDFDPAAPADHKHHTPKSETGSGPTEL